MFVNPKVINQMIKRAYKMEGVRVAKYPGMYIISPCGFSWTLQALEDELDNKIKACIIELAGELPEAGKAFKMQKDYDLTYDIDMLDWEESHPEQKKAELMVEKVVITDRWNGYYRVLKDKHTKEHMLITDEVMSIIDKHQDKSEDPVEGPYIAVNHSQRATWSNCTGVFSIMLTSYPEEGELAAAVDRLNKG